MENKKCLKPPTSIHIHLFFLWLAHKASYLSFGGPFFCLQDGLVSGLPCSVTAHPVEEWPQQEPTVEAISEVCVSHAAIHQLYL